MELELVEVARDASEGSKNLDSSVNAVRAWAGASSEHQRALKDHLRTLFYHLFLHSLSLKPSLRSSRRCWSVMKMRFCFTPSATLQLLASAAAARWTRDSRKNAYAVSSASSCSAAVSTPQVQMHWLSSKTSCSCVSLRWHVDRDRTAEHPECSTVLGGLLHIAGEYAELARRTRPGTFDFIEACTNQGITLRGLNKVIAQNKIYRSEWSIGQEQLRTEDS